MSEDLKWLPVSRDLPPDNTRICFVLDGGIEHGVVIRSLYRPWFVSPYGRWAPASFGGSVSLWMLDPLPDFTGRKPIDLKRVKGDSITMLQEGFSKAETPAGVCIPFAEATD